MVDQYTLRNPATQYPKSSPEFKQQQQGPGLEKDMHPKPDAGEQTYRGTGRLTGRKAIITGADSGTGYYRPWLERCLLSVFSIILAC